MSGKPITPLAAADAIIEIGDKIVLIERKNEPRGHAIPGGFMDLGECAEEAARGLDRWLGRGQHCSA